MKTGARGIEFYTGRPVNGFFYGVGDRNFDPLADAGPLAERLGRTAPGQVRQVHGDRIVDVAAAADASCEADAIEVAAGESAVIRIADCVPILLLSSAERKAVAVHAGWRGTYARIVLRALERFADPGSVYAYIGPAIGACCYRVDPELAGRFRQSFGEGPWVSDREDGPHLDLQQINARLLETAGVAQIEVEAVCTRDAADLHSFRRDGERAGRLGAFVFVDP